MLRLITLALCLSAHQATASAADPASPFIESALTRAAGDDRENHLRELISAHPGQASLHFHLGTLLSREQRWPEARQAYAQAEALAPGQADILYNLAVCLDHLEQTAAASQHYSEALAVAANHPHNFRQSAARQRLEQLLAVLP
jgi:Flp pilus assembly protein TadD